MYSSASRYNSSYERKGEIQGIVFDFSPGSTNKCLTTAHNGPSKRTILYQYPWQRFSSSPCLSWLVIRTPSAGRRTVPLSEATPLPTLVQDAGKPTLLPSASEARLRRHTLSFAGSRTPRIPTVLRTFHFSHRRAGEGQEREMISGNDCVPRDHPGGGGGLRSSVLGPHSSAITTRTTQHVLAHQL